MLDTVNPCPTRINRVDSSDTVQLSGGHDSGTVQVIGFVGLLDRTRPYMITYPKSPIHRHNTFHLSLSRDQIPKENPNPQPSRCRRWPLKPQPRCRPLAAVFSSKLQLAVEAISSCCRPLTIVEAATFSSRHRPLTATWSKQPSCPFVVVEAATSQSSKRSPHRPPTVAQR